MEKEYSLKFTWTGSQYEVTIPELGPGVKATGTTTEEAVKSANLTIAKHQCEQTEEQEARAS